MVNSRALRALVSEYERCKMGDGSLAPSLGLEKALHALDLMEISVAQLCAFEDVSTRWYADAQRTD
jgi:hypothetical protein